MIAEGSAFVEKLMRQPLALPRPRRGA
jgi:hypothetical protein